METVTTPELREGVAALRVPRGVLYQDAHRWQVLLVPASATPEGAHKWLSARGLLAGCEVPKVRPRLGQIFRVKPGESPSDAQVRIAPGARFSCACCGKSCRGMRLGSILPADAARLLALDWTGTGHDPANFFLGADEQLLEGPPTIGSSGSGWIELRRVDGGCQFLRPDNLCEVHARFGEMAKPAMCRIFPFEFRVTEAGLIAGVRLGECVSAEEAAQGTPLEAQQETLRALHREVGEVALVPPLLWLAPGALVRLTEVEALEEAVLSAPPPEPGGLSLALRLLDALEAKANAPALPPSSPDLLAPLLATVLEPRTGLPLAGPPLPLSPRALALEERFARASVFAKDAAQYVDLTSGAAQLVLAAKLGRLRARALSAAQGLAEVPPALLAESWKKIASLAVRRQLSELQLSPRAAARFE